MRVLRLIIAGWITGMIFVTAATSTDPLAIQEEIEASRLGTDALDVSGVVIEIGPVKMKIRSGMLFPVDPVAGDVREMVFLGDATIELAPPNEIEANQLEFHTGNPRLAESIDEATLVICRHSAVEALLNGRRRATPTEATVARAAQVFEVWRHGKEREVIGVDAGILMDALGDPAYESFFAGRFVGKELGPFLVSVDPDAHEQVSVGQFVRAELTEAEARSARRRIKREQRKERLLGISLDDLGTFDQWMMASLTDGAGQPTPGSPPYEATHYQMDITIGAGGERITGSATIDIEATETTRGVVRFAMARDLRLTDVVDAQGNPLPFVQEFGTAYAVLSALPESGVTRIRVQFEGVMIAKLQGTLFVLTDTTNWYPHVGGQERATYDVTFHWPERLDVVAAGRRIEGSTCSTPANSAQRRHTLSRS